jgi:chromosome segregation protein
MKIRKLELIGFKSFSDRTTLLFDDGITSVVGPNGCGKSNVVDAIRWVLGEMSSKNLRGNAMTDIIFNGSDSRGPLGMAEVGITFSTEGGIEGAPPEYQQFGEVTVTRRLHRDGESEYFINKTPCRLRDIHDLFLGTGVGRGAYSIIEQGKIGLIVNSKASERRALIEEAAGITKFRTRKEQTLRKLEHTKQNMLRVADTVEELAKQKANLTRQAQKAERYQRYRAELRDVDLWRASHKYLEHVAVAQVLAGEAEAAERRVGAAAAALAAGDAEVELLRVEQLDLERGATALAEAAFDLENRIRIAQMQGEQAARERLELDRRGLEAAGEIDRLGMKRSALEDERERLVRSLAELDARARAEGAGLAEGDARLRALDADREAGERALAAARKAHSEAQARLSGLEAKLVGVERRRVELGERLAQNRTDAETVATEVARLDEEGGGLRERLATLKEARHALGVKKEALEATMFARREELRQCAKQAEALRLETGARRAKLASLDEIARSYEGCAPGTRALMAAEPGASPWPGVLGLVGDMLEAPRQYEAALEAALGERLQYLVVDEPERACDAVHWLRAGARGRSGFVPAQSARAPWDAEGSAWKLPAADAPGVVGRLVDLVQAKGDFGAGARALLGDVVVMQDLPSALALWRSNGHLARLVTLDGEVVDPRGAVSGGGADPAGASLVTRRRERAELAARIDADAAAIQAAEARAGALREELGRIEQELEAVRGEVHAADLESTGWEKDLGRVQSEVQRLFQQAGQLEEGRAAFEAALRACEAEDAECRRLLAEGRATADASETERERLEAEAETRRAAYEELLTAITETKARVAVVQERREHVEEDIERTDREKGEIVGRVEKLCAEIAHGAARQDEIDEQLALARGSLAELVAEQQARTAELASARDRLEQARVRLGEAELGVKAARAEEKGAAEALSALQLRQREDELGRQHLEETVQDRYREELKNVVGDFQERTAPGTAEDERIDELRRLIERMGEVNLTAVDELREVDARHGELAAQKLDLETAVANLEEAITKMNKTARQRFRETFHTVNENFGRIFPRLFRGGRAQLELVGEDVLEAGVEIVAQPPGKKLQSVGLLSGGEKALTAISLLFAIFTLKPSPFCLLDEVDAPLDEANVGRYNEMIREMTSHSQFILITHNKTTMQLADTLYGVTMEEPGVSKLVSVRMSNADEPRAGASTAAAA